jgi:hypothetical protein
LEDASGASLPGKPRQLVAPARVDAVLVGCWRRWGVAGSVLAAQLLGVGVDGVPVRGVGPGRLGDRLPATLHAGEDLQPVGGDT